MGKVNVVVAVLWFTPVVTGVTTSPTNVTICGWEFQIVPKLHIPKRRILAHGVHEHILDVSGGVEAYQQIVMIVSYGLHYH